MNGLTRVVNRTGRGYSFDAIRAKVLFGGKKKAMDTEYKQVSLAMKIKRPKVDRVYVVDPPKLHKEKRKRGE